MGTPSAEYHPKGAGPRCTGVRRPTGPAGPEPRKEGPPLGIQEAQGSMSAKQCPQDEALAWPICSVTFSTHSLARQTRQTHSAPAFRAPWPCPAHAQPDNELCGSAAGGWTRLDGEGRRPRLPAVGKARPSSSRPLQAPHHQGSGVQRQRQSTQPVIAEGRGAGVQDLDPPGVHRSKGVYAQPQVLTSPAATPCACRWPGGCARGHGHRGLPVKGTLKWFRRADRHTCKLFLV